MPRMMHRPGPPASGQKVMLATPSYGGVEEGYTYALSHSVAALAEAGIQSEVAIYTGDCHVDDARNRIVRQFLKSDCTDLVFLDADLRWGPADLVSLCRHDRDVVAATYPLKQDKKAFPVRFLPGDVWTDEDGLIEVECVPTGFLRIRRIVLERLVECAEKYRGKSDRGGPYTPLIFERKVEAGTRWGGDYTFCRKWRAMGGQIWVMPDARMEHIGTFAWRGSLSEYLRRKHGLDSPRFREALGALRGGSDDPELFTTLYCEWGNEWAAGPGFLATAAMLAREHGPVLECGSGLSTLVLGAMGIEVHSLEHDLAWYRRIKGALERYKIASVRLSYAPLDKSGWYTSPFGPNTEFGLVLIDGPPRQYGRDGLFRILPHAVKNAVWLMDDADDPQQDKMLRDEATLASRDVQLLDNGRIAVSKPWGP